MKRKYEFTSENLEEMKDLLDYLNAICSRELVCSIKDYDDSNMAKRYAMLIRRSDEMKKLINEVQNGNNK